MGSSYRYADALIGLLVDRYGEDNLVIVVSDHRFEPGVLLESLTGMHETDDTEPIARLESDSTAAEQEILEELRALGYLE